MWAFQIIILNGFAKKETDIAINTGPLLNMVPQLFVTSSSCVISKSLCFIRATVVTMGDEIEKKLDVAILFYLHISILYCIT